MWKGGGVPWLNCFKVHLPREGNQWEGSGKQRGQNPRELKPGGRCTGVYCACPAALCLETFIIKIFQAGYSVFQERAWVFLCQGSAARARGSGDGLVVWGYLHSRCGSMCACEHLSVYVSLGERETGFKTGLWPFSWGVWEPLRLDESWTPSPNKPEKFTNVPLGICGFPKPIPPPWVRTSHSMSDLSVLFWLPCLCKAAAKVGEILSHHSCFALGLWGKDFRRWASISPSGKWPDTPPSSPTKLLWC